MNRIYIAGPMTGLPEYNLPAFARAKVDLDAMGFDAQNPGYRGVVEGYTWRDYIRDGLILLLSCDSVALLDGWENSTGANLEVTVARSLKMEIRTLAAWLSEVPRA